MRAFRLPPGLSSVVARLRATDEVSFVVCARERDAEHHYLARPAPIHLPPLAERAAELDRVIAEYAADAIAELGAPPGCFTESVQRWAAWSAGVEWCVVRGERMDGCMKKTTHKRLSLRREAIRQMSDSLILGVRGAGLQASEPTTATDCFNTCGGPNICAGIARA